MKSIIVFLFSLLILFSCDMESTSGANQKSESTTSTPGQPSNDRSIGPPPIADSEVIASKKVGQITKDATEEDIIKTYGKANVQHREIGLGEGEIAPGTIVFPGTKDELIIEWVAGKEYKKIHRIRIEGEGSDWHTDEGIKIGTTLEELVEINGGPFKFYGFEWDYAGTANEWEGGKISKTLTVVLTPDNPEAVFPDLLGDRLYSSDHPKAEAAALRVSSIVINFS